VAAWASLLVDLFPTEFHIILSLSQKDAVPDLDTTPDLFSQREVEAKELGEMRQVNMQSNVRQTDSEVVSLQPTLLTSRAVGCSKGPTAAKKLDSAQPRTVFGVMADRAEQSARVDGIEMESFFATCGAYREFLTKVGVTKFLISDFDHNFQMVHDFYKADPEGRATLAKLCAVKGYPEPKVSWLLWGMEFFLMVLQKVWEGDQQAGKVAYDLTLSKHHNGAQRLLTRSFLAQVPNSKEAICDLKPLLLSPADAQQSHELIDKEAGWALQTFGPTLREAVAISAAAVRSR